MRQRMGECPEGQGTWDSASHPRLTQYLMVLPSGSVSSPHLAKQEGEGALLARGLNTWNAAPPSHSLGLLKSERSQGPDERLPLSAQPVAQWLARVGTSLCSETRFHVVQTSCEVTTQAKVAF